MPVNNRPDPATAANPALETGLPAGLPADWHLDRDLPCPQCRYNLRMLRDPRCPECGTALRWQQVLFVVCPRCAADLADCDADACPRCALALDWVALLGDAPAANRRLYEYAPRPLWPGVRAGLASLFPRSFWRRIPLEAPPATRRLRRLRLVGFVVGLAGLLSLVAVGLVSRSVGSWITMCAAALGLPVLTALLLPRFTPTLARFRIRREQLLRVFAYASFGVGWIGILLLVFSAAMYFGKLSPAGRAWRGYEEHLNVFVIVERLVTRGIRLRLSGAVPFWPRFSFHSHRITVVLFIAIALFWWWRYLYVALRHYLRLPRTDAFVLLLSTQIVALLILTLLLLSVVPLTPDGQRLLAKW